MNSLSNTTVGTVEQHSTINMVFQKEFLYSSSDCRSYFDTSCVCPSSQHLWESHKSWSNEKLPSVVGTDKSNNSDDSDDLSLPFDDDDDVVYGQMQECAVRVIEGVEWEFVGDSDDEDGYLDDEDDDDDVYDLAVASKWKHVFVDETAWRQMDKRVAGSKEAVVADEDGETDLVSVPMQAALHMSFDKASAPLPRTDYEAAELGFPCFEVVLSYYREDDEVSLLYDDPDVDDPDCLPESTISVLRFCLDDWEEDLVDCDVGVDSDSDSEVDCEAD